MRMLVCEELRDVSLPITRLFETGCKVDDVQRSTYSY